jgi:multidrug resistance efflux pump
MNPLDPIPSPAGHHWREFRIKILPVIGFLLVLATVAVMWKQYVASPSILGEVETDQVNVISTVPGLLAELHVDRFSCVTKDQVIGRIFQFDPDQLEASLAAVEIDLKILKARMDLDRTRNAQSLAELRNALDLEQLALRAAEIQLKQAESEFQRAKKLSEDKVIALGSGLARNDFGYEVAMRDRDRLLAEVESHRKSVAELKTAMQSLERFGGTEFSEVDPLIEQAITAQKNKLLLLEGPIELRSPIDGIVSVISQRSGARVIAGAPILMLTPAKPVRIVGYVRQPLHTVPKTGDRVQIRTRGQSRSVAYGQVLRVGSDMQQVTAPMRVRGYDNSQERGLPFLVSLPPELAVYPGELVDLIIPQR